MKYLVIKHIFDMIPLFLTKLGSYSGQSSIESCMNQQLTHNTINNNSNNNFLT